MDANTFDAMTRRASLRTLGTAGLVATFTHPSIAKAKKKKRKKGDAKKLCKKQVGQCTDFFTPGCGVDPAECLERLACCSILKNCDFFDFILCLDEAIIA